MISVEGNQSVHRCGPLINNKGLEVARFVMRHEYPPPFYDFRIISAGDGVSELDFKLPITHLGDGHIDHVRQPSDAIRLE